MPLYGFVCEQCGEEFEELVLGGSSLEEIRCPKCSSEKVQRQLSLVAAMSRTGSSSDSSLNTGCAPSG
jgi:putative FmdB family regulatory protein